LFFNYALKCAIRSVQVIQGGLKLNGTHQLRVYAGDVNTCILGGSVYTTKEQAEAFVVVSKETGLEEITDKTRYTVMSRDQNAGRIHSMKNDKRSFERAEEFKYLTTT
jgi:hypothetical protein